MSMQQAHLELNIEQLLLPDLPYAERVAVAAAVEEEFGRLWREQGVPSGFAGDSLALSMARIEVAAGLSSAGMGAQVAQALYSQLAGGQPATTATKGGIR